MGTGSQFEDGGLNAHNKFENEKDAREAAESGDVKLDAFVGKIVRPELYVSVDNPTLDIRYDLQKLLLARLEVVADIQDELPRHKQVGLKVYGDAVINTDDESYFHVQDEIETSSASGAESYATLSSLIDDIRIRFIDTFEADIDILELAPRDIYVTTQGGIVAAEFDLISEDYNLSSKFDASFPDADSFRVIYDWSKSKPHDHFSVRGYDDQAVTKTIKLRRGATRD